MKRYVGAIICLLIAAGIQGNLHSAISILGAKPDLILVVLIAYSLAADPEFGATLGFIAGLIHGCTVGLSLGSFIVTRTITGLLAGLVTTRVFSDNPIVPMLSAMWLTLVSECLFLLANPRPSLTPTARILIGECIYNALFTLLVYGLLRNLDNRRKMKLINSRL